MFIVADMFEKFHSTPLGVALFGSLMLSNFCFQIFKKKIQEFREACYALTGYRVDVIRENQYRLQSMYAERSTDDLLFEV